MTPLEKLNSTMDGERISLLTNDKTQVEAVLQVDPLEEGYRWDLSDVEVTMIGPNLYDIEAAPNPNWQISRFNVAVSRFDSTLSLYIQSIDGSMSIVGEIVDVDLIDGEYPNIPSNIQQQAVELQALGLSTQQAYITSLKMADQNSDEIAEILDVNSSIVHAEIGRSKEKYIASKREAERFQRLRDRLGNAYNTQKKR